MAKVKAVFLDANVVLEVLLNRAKNKSARAYISSNAGDMCISALTAHLVMYYGQKKVGSPVLRSFLKDYVLHSLTEADFSWAFMNARTADFEDALQLAVAIRTGCDVFATFDKQLYKTYKDLPIISVQLLD